MKLESARPAMMIASTLFVLFGCKPKSGLEQLISQMDGAKSIRSKYVIHAKDRKDIEVDFLYTKPNRFLITSADFIIDTNESDGHFESVYNEKMYDAFAWDGRAFPGTGKLVPTEYVSGGPATGLNPAKFAPDKKWILESKANGVETYTKTVDSMAGPQTYKLIVKSDGQPVNYIVPGNVEFQVKSFEYLDEQPIEKFHVEPRDGFVCMRTTQDSFRLVDGETFDWSKFKAAEDVRSFNLTGSTLFALLDPNEPTSQPAMEWMKKSSAGLTKVSISKGAAASGFYDPDGKAIDELTTTTPTFVLVDSSRKIIGLWMGFDPEGIAAFEADIQKAIKEKD